MMEAT
jgi:hypothetical protein